MKPVSIDNLTEHTQANAGAGGGRIASRRSRTGRGTQDPFVSQMNRLCPDHATVSFLVAQRIGKVMSQGCPPFRPRNSKGFQKPPDKIMRRIPCRLALVLSLISLFMLGTIAALFTVSTDRERQPVQRVPGAGSLPDASPVVVATTLTSPSPGASSPSSTEVDFREQSSFTLPALVVPVVGVRADQLRDTFDDTRSESRAHHAIDITAPLGATVVAAAEGRIVRLFFSDKGGVTIYQTSTGERFVFYYAHLQRYAEGLKEGQLVRQGDTIGFVGDTGNAGAGNYHLHFAVWVLADPKHYWDGVPVNPYAVLRDAH